MMNISNESTFRHKIFSSSSEDLWIFWTFSGFPRRGAYPSKNSNSTGPSDNMVCNLRKKMIKMYHGKFEKFVKNPVKLNDNELTDNSTSWWRTLTATPRLSVTTSLHWTTTVWRPSLGCSWESPGRSRAWPGKNPLENNRSYDRASTDARPLKAWDGCVPHLHGE